MTVQSSDILALARRLRLPLHDEKATQIALARYFEDAGIPAAREVGLGDGDIVDFLTNGIAVELKIKGSPKAIYRQLERYARHECVREIVLLTSRSMTLPPRIGAKPAHVASLSVGWL